MLPWSVLYGNTSVTSGKQNIIKNIILLRRALCIMQCSRKFITIQTPSHRVLAAMLWTHSISVATFCHNETKGNYYSKAISIANSDAGQCTFSVFPPLLCPAPGWDGIRVIWWLRASCQAVLPRDVTLPELPAPTGCQPGLPGMCHPCSSCCHRPQGHHIPPHGGSGAFTAEPASLKCTLERNPLPSWSLLVSIETRRNLCSSLNFSPNAFCRLCETNFFQVCFVLFYFIF